MSATDTRKISVCITTYNRPDLTPLSFQKVLADSRVEEVIILDDCSTDENWNKLQDSLPKDKKISLYRQEKNVGMSLNKRDAIKIAKSEWCIIFDSDNVMDVDYLDAIYMIFPWRPNTIYCPSFAKPNLDYRKFEGENIGRWSAKSLINDMHFERLINTCNYFVNRKAYLDAYQYNDVGGSDTTWFNYCWLMASPFNNFHVVKDLSYVHLVHKGSGWLQDRQKNLAKFREIVGLIRKL